MKRIGRRGPAVGTFVEEWWELYAEPNLERSTLVVYRWAWEHHARPRLAQLRLREVTPLTIARFRVSLEAGGAGPETIRKTLTMLQSVFQRAVEWQLLEANPVRAARKPPLLRARAVPAIGPGRDGAGGSAGARSYARRAADRPARLRRPAAGRGARPRAAPRALADAGGRAGGLGRAAEGAEEPAAAPRGATARAAARRPSRFCARGRGR